MENQRPNPDELLNAVQKEEGTGAQLRVYLGYAAGVGKSYAMLKNAHELKKQGVDVVVGYLEVHGRAETEALMEGLEALPHKQITVAGATLKEFDLDAALARKPQVVLVDELAHTNAATCRHIKRWQDVEELLRAGISVHTTLNVQHLASLNDIVAQITGVQVRETIPDSVFDKADEITLVDLSPDELLKRLKAGKIYRDAQAQKALGNYFKKSNLVALREIALRRTAQRVHADVDQARLTANIQTVLPTQERLACLIDSDAASASALRATARLAGALQCPWTALQVSSARQLTRLPGAQENIEKQTRLAAELGGKVDRRSGAFFIAQVLNYVREENITKLLLARPSRWNWDKWLERLWLFFFCQQTDVLWVPSSKIVKEESKPARTPGDVRLRPYVETTGIVLICFAVAALLGYLNAPEANLAIVYLLAVIIAAILHGEGASAYAAILSSLILSFGLTNFTFRASWFNAQYLVSFGLSLGIGLLASQMTSRLKNQAELARREREQAEALYEFTTALAATTGLHQTVATAQQALGRYLGHPVVLLLPVGAAGSFAPLMKGGSDFEKDPANFAVADWVANHNEPAGLGTQTLPQAKALYVPVKGAESTQCVMAVIPKDRQQAVDLALCRRFAQPLANRMESAQIAEKAESLYWQAERDRLRGDLLSSVSEGLKMPLTVLAMSSAELYSDGGEELNPRQKEILEVIRNESGRLQRLVDNLTQLTRLEIGNLPLKMQRVDLNEFVSDEIFKLEKLTGSHPINLNLAHEPVWVNIDPLLFGQVIHNIIDNAVQHTPRQTQITLATQKIAGGARLTIEDEGDGIPEGHLEKIFEKYYRLSQRGRGAGLGLTVCRAIVTAHHARLWAENRHPKGLRMVVEMAAAL